MKHAAGIGLNDVVEAARQAAGWLRIHQYPGNAGNVRKTAALNLHSWIDFGSWWYEEWEWTSGPSAEQGDARRKQHGN